MTTTNELYLPTRLVYKVKNAAKLRRILDEHPAMVLDPSDKRWVWIYVPQLHRSEFPEIYAEADIEHDGIVIGSCRMPRKDTFYVFLRGHFRASRFLSLFDRRVPRSVARGEFIDTYNRVLTLTPDVVPPPPEHFFKGKDKIEFFDSLSLLENAKTKAETLTVLALIEERQKTETLSEFQRTRLDLFYEEGVKNFEELMRFRELMVMFQHNTGKPVRPYEFIMDMVLSDGLADGDRLGAP